jgi:signal transduction histidine kinase
MLAEFIMANRDAIIAQTRDRVAQRMSPRATATELSRGIPIFLTQLVNALQTARSSDVVDHERITDSAALHGRELFQLGLTIAQVVHDYGDVCQVVTELAIKQHASIEPEQFRTLNLCLDDAIAGAVTEYTRLRESHIEEQRQEHLADLSHELLNLLNVAVLAFESLRTGRVAIGGSTGTLLERSLMQLRDLSDRSLADIRLVAQHHYAEVFTVASFLEDLEVGSLLQAHSRELVLEIGPVGRDVQLEGDRQILTAALANLVQNAFKFTLPATRISLTTRVTDDRVLFEVADHCGGLPPGRAEELFHRFEQRGTDRTGSGLGLSIALKAAQANHGKLSVRDVPGTGCVFTLDLPRCLLPS